MKTTRYLATSVAGLLAAAPVFAASPDQIYEFTVISDTVQTPALCNADKTECIGGVPPTFTEGPVPYKLGTLTLTHKALRNHEAQLSDVTDPPTDDGRIVTFSVANLPGDLSEAAVYLGIPETSPFCPSSYTDRLFQTIPPCSYIARSKTGSADGYTLDLGPITKNHLSGEIDITDVQQHGYGCALQMQGHNNNWSGTWECIAALGSLGSLHSFTAISARVGGG